MTGLVNASLLIYTRSVLPDTTTLPHFTTPRPRPHSKTSSVFTFVSSSADFISEKAASLNDGAADEDDDFRFKPEVRRMVSADETSWKKVRTVPLGGVTPFVLPPLRSPAPSASSARASPSPPPAPSAARRTSNAMKSFLLKPADPQYRPDIVRSSTSDATPPSSSSSSAAKRKSLKKLTIPQPILPRLRPSPPLMMDTEYFFSGNGSSSRAPLKVHVRQSVESFESYDAKPTQ